MHAACATDVAALSHASVTSPLRFGVRLLCSWKLQLSAFKSSSWADQGMQWPVHSFTTVKCFRLYFLLLTYGHDNNSLCNTITSNESVQAAKELGLQLTTVNETLVDMAVTLMQLGIAVPRPKRTE